MRYHGGTSLTPVGRKADRAHITVGASVIVAQQTTLVLPHTGLTEESTATPHTTPPLLLPTERQPHGFLVHSKALRCEEGAGLRIHGPDIQGNRCYAVFFRGPDHGLDESLPNAMSLIRLID